jgi:hypothetical protein
MKDVNFAKFYNEVIDSGVWAVLSPKARAVYPVLVRHADSTTRNCRPGVKRLASKAGINIRTVSAATEELVKCGVIKKSWVGRRIIYHVHNDVQLKARLSVPTRKDRRTSPVRRRDSSGRFIHPLTMDGSFPRLMGSLRPSRMGHHRPSGMVTIKTPLTRPS